MYKPPHISSMYFSQDVFIVAVLKSIQLLILKVTQRVLILKLSLRTQQQQIIASFTASSTKRHLVLEGPAGTGKTLTVLQVANNLIESLTGTYEKTSSEPVLVVTTHGQGGKALIMKYLDASTGAGPNKIFMGLQKLKEEFEVCKGKESEQLLQMIEALAKRFEMLVDEIRTKKMLSKLKDQSLPDSVRMILVLNPIASNEGSPLTLCPGQTLA